MSIKVASELQVMYKSNKNEAKNSNCPQEEGWEELSLESLDKVAGGFFSQETLRKWAKLRAEKEKQQRIQDGIKKWGLAYIFGGGGR
ncbi:MAG: hypothetical protein AB4080_10085 [Trichodesmium sp.]